MHKEGVLSLKKCMHVAFLVALLDLGTACHKPKSVFSIPNTIFSGHLQTLVLSIVLILDVTSVIARRQSTCPIVGLVRPKA